MQPKSARLVDSETVENDHMGSLHLSDSISVPFEFVVFVAIAAMHNRGCWLPCSLRNELSARAQPELVHHRAEQTHSTQAAQRAPGSVRCVAVLT